MAIERVPSYLLLYLMVFSQGFVGYALTSVMGPIVAEIFEGPHYGTIFGTLTVALIGGGAGGTVGRWDYPRHNRQLQARFSAGNHMLCRMRDSYFDSSTSQSASSARPRIRTVITCCINLADCVKTRSPLVAAKHQFVTGTAWERKIQTGTGWGNESARCRYGM